MVCLDLRGACKLNKNKRLPWRQSVPLINQLNSAFTVLQRVSSGFGTRYRNWKLPNTTLHLPTAEQPSEGQARIWKLECLGSQVMEKGRNWMLAEEGYAAPFPQAPSGDLWPPSPGQQQGWVPANKTAFVFP